MKFVSFDHVKSVLSGKRVAVVGSGPSALENPFGKIDSFDVVVRVNNYRVGGNLGHRTDVFYSFFGGSIKKNKDELIRDGVRLCMCKCPDSKPIESEWHVRRNKVNGIDFRYIYRFRKTWWFCDTFIPTSAHFLELFEKLDGHIPTTGFTAIYDLLKCGVGELYVTGYDFFSSGLHNVNQPWRPGDPTDPIGHRPDLEYEWLKSNRERFPLTFDQYLTTRFNLKVFYE